MMHGLPVQMFVAIDLCTDAVRASFSIKNTYMCVEFSCLCSFHVKEIACLLSSSQTSILSPWLSSDPETVDNKGNHPLASLLLPPPVHRASVHSQGSCQSLRDISFLDVDTFRAGDSGTPEGPLLFRIGHLAAEVEDMLWFWHPLMRTQWPSGQ